MSRGHQRKACFGGSLATADPLVAELASNVEHGHSVASLLYDVSQPRAVNEALPGEELADLDEQLLIAACEPGPQSADPAGALQVDAIGTTPAHATILDLMRSVGLPSVGDLRKGNLQSLRAAIRLVSEEEAEELWAALHVLLGVGLRLRSLGKSSHQRAQALIEAARAFDVAFSVYATMRASTLDVLGAAQANAGAQADVAGGSDGASALTPTHRRASSRPAAPCANERDGTELIARAVVGPIGANSRLLERAIVCLRATRAAADAKSWAWVSATNNLACALTLLGNRSASAAGAAMLREATHVLHEALKAHAAGVRREDRALTLVNLAEALLSMAERETPHMRLKKIERAYTASSMALLTVLPVELAWLVRLEHRDLE